MIPQRIYSHKAASLVSSALCLPQNPNAYHHIPIQAALTQASSTLPPTPFTSATNHCSALRLSPRQVTPHPPLSTSTSHRTPHCNPRALLSRPLPHQLLQPQVLPRALLLRLGGALDAKRGVLVGNDVVFVFRVGRLVLWRNVDFFVGKVWGPVEFLVAGRRGVSGWRNWGSGRGWVTSKRSAMRGWFRWM